MPRHPNRPIPNLRAASVTRFEELIRPGDWGCQLWTGSLNKAGYGLFTLGGKQFLAHRIAWTLAKGPIPPALDIDHMCCTRACVNVEHLEPVAPSENTRRQVRPAPGWEPAPESTCFPFTLGNRTWFEVQWWALNQEGKVHRRSRGFDTIEEAQQFQAEIAALPYLGRPRTIVEELPDDVRQKLQKCFTDNGVLLWLKDKNRRLGGKRPVDLVRAGKFDEIRECLSWVTV